MIIPISWSFQRESILPIIEAKAESDEAEYEPFVIFAILEMIETAKKFKGRPYSNMPSFQATNNFSASFSLIFPTEKDVDSFMEFLKTEK